MTALTSPGFRSVGFRDMGSPASFGPVPGAIAIYRFDEGRNLLKYSQEFNNAAWNKSVVTIASALAPNGTFTASLIKPTVVEGIHRIYQGGISISTGIYTFSMYVKAGEGGISRWCSLNTYSTGGESSVYTYFDLATGTIGADGNGGAKIAEVLNAPGWYRISVSRQLTAGSFNGYLYCAEGNGDSTFVGDTINGIYIWGAQLEVGSTPTEYKPTTDKQTLLDYSGNGNHGTLGSTAGVDTNDPTWSPQGLVFGGDDWVGFDAAIAAKIGAAVYAGAHTITVTITPTNLTAFNCVFGQIRIGGTNEWGITLTPNGSVISYRRDGVGDSTLQSSAGRVLANQPSHITVSCDDNQNSIYINSVLVARNAGGAIRPLSGYSLYAGRRANTADFTLYGGLHEIRFHPFALSDTQVAQQYAFDKAYLAPKGVILP